jgi:hypothetical protein
MPFQITKSLFSLDVFEALRLWAGGFEGDFSRQHFIPLSEM